MGRIAIKFISPVIQMGFAPHPCHSILTWVVVIENQAEGALRSFTIQAELF